MKRTPWKTEAALLVQRHIRFSKAVSKQALVCELQAACPAHAFCGLRRRAWDKAVFCAVNALPGDWAPGPRVIRAPTVLELIRRVS